jgi:AraC-like DNA-binding protein
VEQVAKQSGFTDVKYFRTAFTKRFGVSPSRYKNYREKE